MTQKNGGSILTNWLVHRPLGGWTWLDVIFFWKMAGQWTRGGGYHLSMSPMVFYSYSSISFMKKPLRVASTKSHPPMATDNSHQLPIGSLPAQWGFSGQLWPWAARTMPGRVARLYPKAFFETLRDHDVPEILSQTNSNGNTYFRMKKISPSKKKKKCSVASMYSTGLLCILCNVQRGRN